MAYDCACGAGSGYTFDVCETCEAAGAALAAEREAKVLETASDLLQEARRGVRLLDVMAQAVAAYTRDENTRRTWDAFERALTRLGVAEDPEAYCTPCNGEGERPDVGGRMDVCMACHGQGFTGYPRPAVGHLPGSDALPLS